MLDLSDFSRLAGEEEEDGGQKEVSQVYDTTKHKVVDEVNN